MKKDYLILLTETERAMLEEAIFYYSKNYFLGTGDWASVKGREGTRKIALELLKIIKSFDGGIKKLIKKDYLYIINSSMTWYGGFTKGPAIDRKYSLLGNIIEERNKLSYLFDFDPNNYNPKESQKIEKIDFSKLQLLIVREVNSCIDYASVFHRLDNESDEKYKKRANEKLEKENNDTGKWFIIEENDLVNLKISDKCGYFNINN